MRGVPAGSAAAGRRWSCVQRRQISLEDRLIFGCQQGLLPKAARRVPIASVDAPAAPVRRARDTSDRRVPRALAGRPANLATFREVVNHFTLSQQQGNGQMQRPSAVAAIYLCRFGRWAKERGRLRHETVCRVSDNDERQKRTTNPLASGLADDWARLAQ